MISSIDSGWSALNLHDLKGFGGVYLWDLQVSVSLSANESMPGEPVSLRVKADKGSCVCVATVDKSLYLLKPDFQLSPDKVGPQSQHQTIDTL